MDDLQAPAYGCMGNLLRPREARGGMRRSEVVASSPAGVERFGSTSVAEPPRRLHRDDIVLSLAAM